MYVSDVHAAMETPDALSFIHLTIFSGGLVASYRFVPHRSVPSGVVRLSLDTSESQ